MYASLEAAGTRWRVAFVRHLAHPPEKVWRALTEPEQLAKWFPHRIEGEFKAGAPLRFVSDQPADPGFDGEMLRFEPPALMEFTWGSDVLRFTVTPTGEGTRLELTDTFDDLGKAARDASGWHACLRRLGAALDRTEVKGSAEQEWTELLAQYQHRFGPEASTIGPPEGYEFES